MTNAAKDVLARALQLTADERIRLAHDLLESVDSDDEVGTFSQEWIEEIQRRVERVVSGEAGRAEDWQVVLDRIQRRHAERGA